MEISEEKYQELILRNKELENENEKLKQSPNNFYSEILDKISEPTSVIDKNYIYRYVNDAYAKYFNTSTAEIIGKRVLDFAGYKDFDTEIKQHFEKCLNGEKVEHKNSVNFGNGIGQRELLLNYYPHYNHNDKIDGVISTAKDITELSNLKREWKNTVHSLAKVKEQAEEKEIRIKNERKLLFSVLEVIPAFVYLQNKDYTIDYSNKEFNKLFGKPLKRLCYNVVNNRTSPCPNCPTFKVFNTRERSVWEWKSPKGIEYIIYDELFIDSDGSEKILEFGLDISELKRVERELHEVNQHLVIAKEKAEESSRLKTAFLQNISHEIRTPLNAICGFSDMLSESTLSEEKKNSFISIIQTSSNQLLSIVSDILTISSLETKQEKLNIEKACMNDIIIDLLSIFKQQLVNQNISLYAKQALNDKQSEIYTDKTKITQILSNLISNAIKFTHEGFIEFGYVLKNNKLEFYVKDSGVGIKPEKHDKIFERFRQADLSINKEYGGTGLGLSISKGLTELLGGEIWVNSEIGKGSTFYFTIPYEPINRVEEPTLNKTDNRPTILVAEDNEFNFLFIEALFNNVDFNLLHAKDGKEVVEIAEKDNEISLILMDIKMPKMDGYTAAKLIKEQNPEVPIIAQTAYALDHEVEKYSKVFDDYLTKPLKREALLEKVKEYLIAK